MESSREPRDGARGRAQGVLQIFKRLALLQWAVKGNLPVVITDRDPADFIASLRRLREERDDGRVVDKAAVAQLPKEFERESAVDTIDHS
jgi:hypothetical protein